MKMKLLLKTLLLLAVLPGLASAQIHRCKNPDGSTSYQEQACESETIKTFGDKQSARKVSEKEMLKALSMMTGKSISELNTPKYREAAEALVVTDVSKAYAFTLVHEAPLQYCDNSVRNSMKRFKSRASNAILLGRHYYSEGINLKIGEKEFVKSGAELTSALQDMIDEKKIEYARMSKPQLQRLCSQTKQALDMLALSYSN